MQPPYAVMDSMSSWPLRASARDAIEQTLGLTLGDLRGRHLPATLARRVWDQCREASAAALAVHPDEITFTPSGTHAVHAGLAGLLLGQRELAGSLALSAIEHSAVFAAARWAEQHYRRTWHTLPVDPQGHVVPVTERAAVYAVQAANGEIGTVQDLAQFDGAPLFVDACALAGLGRLPDEATVAAFSAHKWGGGGGVGLLVVRRRSGWRAPFPSDDRSDPRSVGLENLVAIAGATSALVEVTAQRDAETGRYQAFSHQVRTALRDVPDLDWLGDPQRRLPHLVAFSALYVQAEELLRRLDQEGFGTASGSACTADALEPSHVLRGTGSLTHGNLRLGWHDRTTTEDVARLCAVLPGLIGELRD